MKILFVDLLFEFGNRHVDNCMMDAMAKNHEVFLLMNEDFVIKPLRNKNNIHILGNKYTNNKGNAVVRTTNILKRMKYAANVDRKLNPDVIFISVYETRTFPIGLLFFRNPNKIVVVENYNIDFLRFKIQNIAYKTFAHRVHHLVYEPLFKDYIINTYHLDEKLVHCVPHIQYMKDAIHNEEINNDSPRYDCIAISSSNDPKLVRKIVEREEQEHFFRKNKIRTYIKCNEIEYNSEYLRVNGNFIANDEYDNLYSKTKVVLVPFPLTYKYRMSGCIVDAFSHHKPVISSNIALAEYYSSIYGSCIKTATDTDKLLELVKYTIDNIDKNIYDFEKFAYDHSQDEVERSLTVMFNRINKN